MTSALFICPVCGAPLHAEGKSYYCPVRHTFDIARGGYVNLMTGRAGKSAHGDNREMVEARRAFLDAGYYEPLMRALADAAATYAPPGARILDAGCGECSYTDRIFRAVHDTRGACEVVGIDLSKEALLLGGRRSPSLSLAVASLYHLPLADESFDLVFEIFAPFCEEEYARVLRPGGKLIMVIPGPLHLFGLKSVLYEHPYENEVADTALSCFRLLTRQSVRDTIHLRSAADVWSLFTMTPYFYRTSPTDKEKLRTHASLETEISFEILVYEKS